MLLAAIAAATIVTTVGTTTEVVHADTCTPLTFASTAEREWVQRVTSYTDNLSCSNARWIYRNQPSARDEYPGNRLITSTATKLPSPAFQEGAQAARQWCRITTVNRYRAPIAPFGDHTLFSLRMTQEFSYDGLSVAVGPVVLDADTTANGWRWHWEGVVSASDVYFDTIRNNYQHQSDRYGKFATDGVPPIGVAAVASTLRTMIWVQANGDWRTLNEDGLAGCGNA